MYTIEPGIYNVREREKELGEKLSSLATEEDFEYEVFLMKNEKIVDSFDSIENFEGHHLTKEECERAIKEIRKDVEDGKARSWFTLARE